MAEATTETFDEMVLETSDDGTTWTKLCGLIDVTLTRVSNMDTTEVPDCTDESLPLSLKKSVRSIEVSVSATGVWAQESHEELMDWFYNSEDRRFRVSNTNAASGDTEIESGTGFLENVTQSRQKGQVVTASVALAFNGTPTRTAAA